MPKTDFIERIVKTIENRRQIKIDFANFDPNDKKIIASLSEIAKISQQDESFANSAILLQEAYLFTYYRVEYISQYLTLSFFDNAFENLLPILNKNKIKLLPPCINKSQNEFAPVDDFTIRYALFGNFDYECIVSIRDGHRDCIEAKINNERIKKQPFSSLEDFIARVKNAPTSYHSDTIFASLDKLILCGAFDCFGHTRKAMYDGWQKFISGQSKTINIEHDIEYSSEEIERFELAELGFAPVTTDLQRKQEITITIHKGTNEIGGSCIEIATDATGILLDYGTPLSKYSSEFSFDNQKIDGILISHPHQDHFGEIVSIKTDMPIYCGKLSVELMNATRIFTQKELLTNSFHTFEAWKSFWINDIKITPFLVDHSAVDAYAFLIEASGRKIIYSGDFRANGRKSKLFENMLKDRRLANADVLLMEGTMLCRSNDDFPDEQSVEDKIFETINNSDMATFMIGSSQNIDSIVSAYRACKKSKKTFVVDIYTAWILEKVSAVPSSIPNIAWSDVMVLSNFGGKYYEKIKSNETYFGNFKSKIFKNTVSIENLAKNPSKYFMKISPWHIEAMLGKLGANNANLIYSQWLGYLKPEFSDDKTVELFERLKSGYNWVYAHTSGHADLESLKRFAATLAPKRLIPIHTEHKLEFKNHFKNVIILEDGEKFDLSQNLSAYEVKELNELFSVNKDDAMDNGLKYFQLAKELNDKYSKMLNTMQLHLRGNEKAMSLVSLRNDTPEKGFSGITSEEDFLERIKVAEKIEKPQRNTPEKLLQATIIKEALLDDNHHLPFGEDIKFITSEMVRFINNKKVVNDILGFSKNGELCIIELKSSRLQKELQYQVDIFEEIICNKKNFFAELLKIYGIDWDKQAIKKIVVWPKGNSGKKFPHYVDEYVYDKYLLENNGLLSIWHLP